MDTVINGNHQNSPYDGPYDKLRFRRLFFRSYFIALFTSCVVAFFFNREFGALIALSLTISLLIFMCCNCGKCYRTRIVSGAVLVAPNTPFPVPSEGQMQGTAYVTTVQGNSIYFSTPNHGNPLHQEVTYIVVPTAPPHITMPSDDHNNIGQSQGSSSFYPPPSYEESQMHNK